MKRQIRQLVYLLLAALLLDSTSVLGLPGPASANTPEPLSSLQQGDTVTFAGYTWIVLNNGASSGSAYLLMQNVLQSGGSEIDEEFDSSGSPSFNNSTSIRCYLNGTGSTDVTSDFLGSLPRRTNIDPRPYLEHRA